ncbi:hypothetical protein LXA43DRAFT_1140910 [Ganoderma leucocontextum]|nr:hypothetical protein LXA43DRAFT_1140910 [Ganoderma leucocontextum]
MGLFYPDNPKRMARLQQLVDSITNMQADLKNIGKQMDDENAQYRPTVNALLKASGMDSVDDVINKAAAQMTPDERKVFEALIKTVKNTKTGFDVTYFIAGLLMAPGGAILTGKGAISIARWASRMLNVKSLANFFTAAEGGESAAAAAATEIVAEAEDAAEALEGVGEAAEVAEVAAEVTEAASIVSTISVALDALAGIGLVVGFVAGVIEIYEGKQQKAKLIDAIHRLQPARLTTAFFKQEGTNILNQLETLKLYLGAWLGSDPDPAMAAKASACPRSRRPAPADTEATAMCTFLQLANAIIFRIILENNEIDLNKLETELETQDRQSSSFYGGADLSHDAVVAATSNN